MGFHFRKNWRLFPFRVTLTERGVTWGVRAGRYGYSPKTGKHTFDTPGLGGVSWGGRSKRRGESSAQRAAGIGGLIKALFMIVVLFALVFVVLSGWPL